jgi:hypothetical protein
MNIAPLPPPQTDDPAAWVCFWLDSALRCRGFYWDPDQQACAEIALKSAVAEANTYAAAPELLAALEPFTTFNSGDETITITVRTADVTRARAAIAKAKGGAA